MNTSTLTVPTPAVMARHSRPAAETIVAKVIPTDPGRIVRPGTRQEFTGETHDGVLKAKHLKKGMVVRPFLHGAPRGSERTVESIRAIRGKEADERGLESGAFVEVTYSSQHPDNTGERALKAAYRFHSAELAGTPVASDVPAFVAYEEV